GPAASPRQVGAASATAGVEADAGPSGVAWAGSVQRGDPAPAVRRPLSRRGTSSLLTNLRTRCHPAAGVGQRSRGPPVAEAPCQPPRPLLNSLQAGWPLFLPGYSLEGRPSNQSDHPNSETPPRAGGWPAGGCRPDLPLRQDNSAATFRRART